MAFTTVRLSPGRVKTGLVSPSASVLGLYASLKASFLHALMYPICRYRSVVLDLAHHVSYPYPPEVTMWLSDVPGWRLEVSSIS